MSKTIDCMVHRVMEWYAVAPESVQDEFRTTNPDNLIQYHNSLGRDIRNAFDLWDIDWTPVMEGEIDCSPDHPDQVSLEVIKQVHQRVQ